MTPTRYHVDQALSAYQFRRMSKERLARIRAALVDLPSASVPQNERDKLAMIAAIDEVVN